MAQYRINYGIYFKNGHYQSGEMIVKNCITELHAKVRLNDFLKRKYPLFDHMVIYKCDEDMLSMFSKWFT